MHADKGPHTGLEEIGELALSPLALGMWTRTTYTHTPTHKDS